MADTTASHRQKKLCFVTIGATAAFNVLIEKCLEPGFLRALRSLDFTDLLIQYGPGKATFDRGLETLSSSSDYSINVSGFDFNQRGLDEEIRAAKGGGSCLEGVMVSHAGMSLHKAQVCFGLVSLWN